MRSVIIAIVLLLLAGCASSPPTRFYTLDPVTPAQHAPLSASITLQVAAVHLPAMLDRQEMVRESAPERLQVSDRDRWGAPLAGMIRGVLEQDLIARLPGTTLLPAGALPPPGARVVVLDVLRFGAGPNGRVRLEGSWSVFMGRSAQPSLTRRIRLTTQAPAADFAAQAAAMSRLLGQLSQHIADALPRISPTGSAVDHAAQNHP